MSVLAGIGDLLKQYFSRERHSSEQSGRGTALRPDPERTAAREQLHSFTAH
jgi:hypothetical protein